MMQVRLFGMLAMIAMSSWLLAVSSIFADEVVSSVEQSTPRRHVLIACGLPGDEEHRQRLTEACQSMIKGSQEILGASREDIDVLAGDETMRNALTFEDGRIDICTKEAMAAALQQMGKEAAASDGCWVFLLGHAHLQGAQSQFNVSGPDFQQAEFAQWAKGITCQEQVFWVTSPLSGFWIKPLTSNSRVVVTATEADLEYTGTEMPYALAKLMDEGGDYYALEDVDHDGQTSLLDLYLSVNLEIDAVFKTMERLQTEHSQLEDNGDGRGKEIQQAYLPVIEEESTDDEAEDNPPASEAEKDPQKPSSPFGVRASVESQPATNMDGYRSQRILLKRPNHAPAE